MLHQTITKHNLPLALGVRLTQDHTCKQGPSLVVEIFYAEPKSGWHHNASSTPRTFGLAYGQVDTTTRPNKTSFAQTTETIPDSVATGAKMIIQKWLKNQIGGQESYMP